MKRSTELKQQALLLRAAFEEGYKTSYPNWQSEWLTEDWEQSTAKQMHDQLLMEAKGGINVRS